MQRTPMTYALFRKTATLELYGAYLSYVASVTSLPASVVASNYADWVWWNSGPLLSTDRQNVWAFLTNEPLGAQPPHWF